MVILSFDKDFPIKVPPLFLLSSTNKGYITIFLEEEVVVGLY